MDTGLKRSIKVINRIVVHFLCGYYIKHPKLRDEQIHYVQHAHNRDFHSSIRISPFETCFENLMKAPLYFVFGKDEDSNGRSDEGRAHMLIQQIHMIHQAVQ